MAQTWHGTPWKCNDEKNGHCCIRVFFPVCDCAPWLCFQVHGLDAETWKKVDVVYIDIAERSQVEPKVNEFSKMDLCVCRLLCPHFVLFLCVCVSLQDYKPEEDPCKYKSVKTGRGPLGPDWKVQRSFSLLLASVWARKRHDTSHNVSFMYMYKYIKNLDICYW